MKIYGLGKVRRIKNIPFSDYNKNKDLSNMPKHPKTRKHLKEEEKYDSNDSQLTFTTPSGSSQDDQSNSESDDQNLVDPAKQDKKLK